jgi:molybdopterin-guanine dinucleotide biosynthesis protein A
MGRDKAELEVGGMTMLDRAITTLSAVAPRVLLATGARTRYAERGLEVVLDRYSDAGPLAGLEAGLSAVRASTAGDALVIVLACDMPHVGADLLRVLLARAAADRELAASLFASDTGPEPLCGVYRTSALAAIRAALDAGERKMLSFVEQVAADGTSARVCWTSMRDVERDVAPDEQRDVERARAQDHVATSADHGASADAPGASGGPAFNVNTPEALAWLRARFAEGEGKPS